MKNKSATRYFSNKQEKRIAKSVGGKQTANSGATMFSKGDVVTKNWLIEAKTKTKPSESITVHKEWLTKNEEEAFAMGLDHNALAFSFGETNHDEDYYIISAKEFKRFLQMEELYNEN